MSIETAMRIRQMLAGAQIVGDDLMVLHPENSWLNFSAPIGGGGQLDAVHAAACVIAVAEEAGVFTPRAPGISSAEAKSGAIKLPTYPGRHVVWGATILPGGRMDVWAEPSFHHSGPDAAVMRVLTGRALDRAAMFCPWCPQLIYNALGAAAELAARRALEKWVAGDAWATGIGNGGRNGMVIMGIARDDLWTGDVWLSGIASGHTDGRMPPR